MILHDKDTSSKVTSEFTQNHRFVKGVYSLEHYVYRETTEHLRKEKSTHIFHGVLESSLNDEQNIHHR